MDSNLIFTVIESKTIFLERGGRSEKSCGVASKDRGENFVSKFFDFFVGS